MSVIDNEAAFVISNSNQYTLLIDEFIYSIYQKCPKIL